MSVPISQAADDLIVACEVGSRAQYEKLYHRPEWPGGASGVTIGIGYDLGYATPEKIKNDWAGRRSVDPAMLVAMLSCSGVTGSSAQALTSQVRSQIDIPWDAAVDVYERVDIPQWTDRVCNDIPGADKLPPDCLGSLTSLAYNRGASFKNEGDRYREMRAIRSHIMAGELPAVSGEIRAMKRLWGSDQRGLLIRRDKEAALWDRGLAAPIPIRPAPPSKPQETPPPLAPAEKPGTPEVGTAGTGAVITGKVTHDAIQSGWSPTAIVVLAGVGLVVTLGTIAYVRYRRNQPIVARQKG